MSNYILWKALTDLGGIVDFTIPNRMKDGYGINQSLVSRAVKDGIDTIITCDNGISAGEAVKYGREQGLTMIVTDHHEVPFEELPDGTGEKSCLKLMWL